MTKEKKKKIGLVSLVVALAMGLLVTKTTYHESSCLIFSVAGYWDRVRESQIRSSRCQSLRLWRRGRWGFRGRLGWSC